MSKPYHRSQVQVCVIKSIQDRPCMNTLYGPKHPSSLSHLRWEKLFKRNPLRMCQIKGTFHVCRASHTIIEFILGKMLSIWCVRKSPPYRKYYKANCYQILYRWSSICMYCIHTNVCEGQSCLLCFIKPCEVATKWKGENKIMYLVCGPTLSSTGCLWQNPLHNRRSYWIEILFRI